MPALVWVAVLVVGWCVASVVTALALGRYLRRRAEMTDPETALRPLGTGPLRMWLGELPGVTTPAASSHFESLVAGLPSPRGHEHDREHDREHAGGAATSAAGR